MDSYERKRKQHGGFVKTIRLDGSAVAATQLQAVRSANHTLFVQQVYVSIQTHVDGKIFTLQDDNSTIQVIASFLDDAEGDTTWGNDHKEWDFGPDGIALTAGKNLDYLANTAGSGFVGDVVVYGYTKLTLVIHVDTVNTAN